ncbi:MAG: flippase-like domain-containing protein [Polyangiaceae bacterium]|nr:flippase-like domain-containing protein [Polyangiaceae bacterium]
MKNPPDEPERLPVASNKRRWLERLALSLLFAAGFVWIALRGGLPLVPPAAAFSSVKWWTVGVYVLSLVVVHWFRAARWRHLLRPVGDVRLRDVVAVAWVGFGAILLSPLRSGEIVRPYLITRHGSVRLWEATGTVGAERIIDGLAVSGILFFALRLATPLDPLPDHIGDLPVPVAAVPAAATGALVLFVGAFAAMGLFFFARDFARRMTFKIVGLVSIRFAEALAGIVERVAEGMRFLPSPKHLVPFLGETAVYWIMNATGVWLLAWGTGLGSTTLAEACVTMACVGIGILVPSGPGYFGAFQLSAYAALAMYVPEAPLRASGAAFVFLLYVAQVGFHVVAMLAGLGALRRTQRVS